MGNAKWLACDGIDRGNGTKFCVFPMEALKPRERCIRHGFLLATPVHGDFRNRQHVRAHILRPADAHCSGFPCDCDKKVSRG